MVALVILELGVWHTLQHPLLSDLFHMPQFDGGQPGVLLNKHQLLILVPQFLLNGIKV